MPPTFKMQGRDPFRDVATERAPMGNGIDDGSENPDVPCRGDNGSRRKLMTQQRIDRSVIPWRMR